MKYSAMKISCYTVSNGKIGENDSLTSVYIEITSSSTTIIYGI